MAAGRKLTISGGAFHHDAAIAGPGTLALSSVTAELGVDLTNADLAVTLSSATLNGPGVLINAAGRTLAPQNVTAICAVDNRGTLAIQGSCRANGPFTQAAGSVLRVGGTVAGATSFVLPAGFTNEGTIELTSTGSAYSSTLDVTAGALVNATINSNIISPDFLKANKQRIFEEEPYLNYYKQ